MEKDNVYKIRVQCLTYTGKFVKLVGKGDPQKFRPVPLRPEDDGVYTYLFDQAKRLHTAKVANRFELGSLHLTLAFESKAERILASGELRKIGNTIEFNLLSGTYMQKWMTEELDKTCGQQVQAQAAELLQTSLPGMKITYTGEDFITDVHVPVTREQLNSYLDAGYEVRLFDDERSCKLNEALIEAQLGVWEKMKMTGPHVEKAKTDLDRTKKFTLYVRAGRKKTRRTKRRLTRRKRRV
jgi:hypothetical protein